MQTLKSLSENSSVGRAQPCQGWGRGFESHFSLFLFARMVELVDTQDLKSCGPYSPCGFKSHSGYNPNNHFMSFNVSYYLLAIAFFFLIGCETLIQENENNQLRDYVSEADASYRYEIIDTVLGDGWKEYKIRMVSGSWLDKKNFDDNSNEWWHWVSMIVPDNIDNSNSCLLYTSPSPRD